MNLYSVQFQDYGDTVYVVCNTVVDASTEAVGWFTRTYPTCSEPTVKNVTLESEKVVVREKQK
jgi:hypothetical protein